MPNRIVRDGILFSVSVSKLSPTAELLYRKLMSVVDDYGRFYAAPPEILISSCYPLQVRDVSREDIAKWLKELADNELIEIYNADGKETLEIKKFQQRMRASKSKFPDNPNRCNTNGSQVTVKRKSADSQPSPEYEYEDEVEDDKRKKRLPKDWKPTDNHKEVAEREGVDLKRAASIFRNWANSNGSVKINWNLAFTNALMNENWMKKVAPAKKSVGADGKELMTVAELKRRKQK